MYEQQPKSIDAANSQNRGITSPNDQAAHKDFPLYLYYDLVKEVERHIPTNTRRSLLRWAIWIPGVSLLVGLLLVGAFPQYWDAILLVSGSTALFSLVAAMSIQRAINTRDRELVQRTLMPYCYELLRKRETEFRLDLSSIAAVEACAEAERELLEEKSSLGKHPLITIVGGLWALQAVQAGFIAFSTRVISQIAAGLLGALALGAVLVTALSVGLDAYSGSAERKNVNFAVRLVIKLWKVQKAAELEAVKEKAPAVDVVNTQQQQNT
jgi:hypothetical protein